MSDDQAIIETARENAEHDLIAKLEAATGPNRDLDTLIAVALHFMDDFDPSVFIVPVEYRASVDGKRIEAVTRDKNGKLWCQASRRPHPYTASIDAALELAPQNSAIGLVIQLEDNPDNKAGRYRATIMPPLSMKSAQDATVYGASLPLAICIAALKSRPR